MEIICSSSNLLSIQKAEGAKNKKKYELNLFNKKRLNEIKTAKKLYLSLLEEFETAKIYGYKKYDVWTEILNNEILNICIRNFSNIERKIYKNFIFNKIRAITRFTYPATIEARDELISQGILNAKKETVKKVDIYKNKLCVYVNNSYNIKKKYLCDIVVNVSGPLSVKKFKNESPIVKSIQKNKGKIFGNDGGFVVNKNFKITSKSNIYLPGYIAHAFNPSRKTIIKAILENSKIAGKDIAKKLFSI